MRKITNLAIIAVLLTVASCTKEKTLIIGPPEVSAKELLNDKRMRLEDITVSDSGAIELVPVGEGPREIFFRNESPSVISCVGCPDPGYRSRSFVPFFEFNTRDVRWINSMAGPFSNSGPISVIGTTEPGSALGIYAQFTAYTRNDTVQLLFAPKMVLIEDDVQIPAAIITTQGYYDSQQVRAVNIAQLTGVYRVVDHAETLLLYGTTATGKFATFTFRK